MLTTRLLQSLSGSRFGRRLLTLFVVCSLLPMTALAVLSYRTVTGQLRRGSLNRLEQTGKGLAGNVADRLRDLNDDLSHVTRLSPCTEDLIDPACDGSLLYGFLTLSYISKSAPSINFFGHRDSLPVFTDIERRQLDAGEGVVLARMVAGTPAFYLTRSVRDRWGKPGILVGRIYPTYLWDVSGQNPLIPTMQLHVVDESNQSLFRTTPATAAPPTRSRAAGSFEWDLGGEPYLAAYAVITQPAGIAMPKWTLVVSEARAAVDAPMAGFRTSFPILALLSLAAALALGLSQIRRQLAPLVALQEGTRRLAANQFDQPVSVSRGDEFGELADSFNAMADQIARQFEQVKFLAFYDNLTGLPNRVSFKRRLESELTESAESNRMFGVCFLDLDHFSRINDTLGHKVGDRLLQLVARQIKSCCLGVAPSASVSRLGGDEFTVILPDLTDPLVAGQVARAILDSFNTPFALDGHEVFVSASIGLAIYPADGDDTENLLKNADAAMYQAKRSGRNTFEFFARTMSTASVKRLTLESQLRKAIDRNQFEIWFQPIVDVTTGRVAKAEALIRWRHPEWGIVLPTEFIPVCEETGLIVRLGAWILRNVCAQNSAWQQQGLLQIPVAVNLSGQQLRGDGVLELVRGALADTELEPRHLVLELTESILMENEGGAAAVLPALSELGVGLAIDDFGTGYSSLSYLKHFPVDTVKIDKSFVKDVTENPNDAAITSAIIAMGHALDLQVVGEGVETPEQAQVLRMQGCDLIQGFWVSRPIPAEAFGAYLREAATAPQRLVLPSPEVRRKRRQAGRWA